MKNIRLKIHHKMKEFKEIHNAILQINLKNIENNYKYLKKNAPNTIIAACVKANSYGLGSDEICKTLYEKNRFGRIINISSVVGSSGNLGQANYAASKAGLEGMTKSIALEVASRGITANCIAPGFIKTAMTSEILEKNEDKIINNIPIKRIGVPDDISSLTKFLASDKASYITGQTFHVNGGMLM